jgi:1-acyl-sn-glycerol-3-phosphate acyltransferase
MPIILSFIFWILLYFCVILLVAFFLPLSLFIKSEKFVNFCTISWSKTILWLLKKILRIDHEIIGLENIPNEPCIIACKHQSMWETIVFHTIFKNSGSYIYKKELLNVPVYGWYVRKMPCIKVDRKGGAKALKDMVRQAKQLLSTNHNIIIFPQGTRTPVGASSKNYPYQVGVAALYNSCNAKVVPVALNSGKFWGKGMLIKKTGCIKMKILEPINPGLKKDEFMQILEERIEENSNNL